MNTHDTSRREFVQHASTLLAGAALAGLPARAAPAPATPGGRIALGELRVARMGFGAMRITGAGIWGEPADAASARALLRRALELGVDFIDTADSYGPAVSERLIAEALHPYPAGLVIATKGGLVRPGPDQWAQDARPERLRAACEASLKRLKLERIDLYQLHSPDANVPYADSVGELARLQQAGKIRHIGVSNVDVAQLAQARTIVEVVSVQNRYNVATRQSDPVLEACEQHGIAFIPWGPLAQRQRAAEQPDPRVAALRAIAGERGITESQATLAWLLARSQAMLPIPGTSRIVHLEENVAAAAIRLSDAEMTRVG
jgi:aryl-alcohol dehydrogenase-like predicted oxidoreductase